MNTYLQHLCLKSFTIYKGPFANTMTTGGVAAQVAME